MASKMKYNDLYLYICIYVIVPINKQINSAKTLEDVLKRNIHLRRRKVMEKF